MSNFKLRISDDSGSSSVVPLTRETITIGRKEGNTIRLTERNVSREHARLRVGEDGVVLEDLSRYGTRIGGAPVKGEKKLEPGETVVIGDYQLQLEAEGASAAAAEVAPAAGQSPQPAETKAGHAKALTKKPKPKHAGGGSGDTAMINLGEFAARERAAGKKRIVADTPMFFVVAGELRGTELRVVGNEVVIGRTPDNDLQLDHRSISRNHARIVKQAGRYTIYDLDSANGMKINGEFYTESILGRGDMVELGHVRMRFLEEGETFAFRPEDYEEGGGAAGMDDGAPEKKGGGGKLLLLGALLLVAGGVLAAWFLYFNKPKDKPFVAASDKAAAADAAKAVAGHGDEAAKGSAKATQPLAATTKPPEPTKAAPEDAGPSAAVKEALAKAQRDLETERWDEAIATFQSVLGQAPNNQEAKDGLAKAQREQKVARTYNAVQTLVQAKDLESAWRALTTGTVPDERSSMYTRYTTLRDAVKAGYSNKVVEEGEKVLRRQPNLALDLANKALGINPENDRARSLKVKALRASQRSAATIAAAASPSKDKPKASKKPKNKDRPKDKPKNKPNTKATSKPKDKPAATAGGAASAGDLYKEGRKLYSSNKAAALAKFKAAAKKGYPRAYRMMGNIYLQQGKSGDAIRAFKKYLRLRPGASDSEAVRSTIIRLGGTP